MLLLANWSINSLISMKCRWRPRPSSAVGRRAGETKPRSSREYEKCQFWAPARNQVKANWYSVISLEVICSWRRKRYSCLLSTMNATIWHPIRVHQECHKCLIEGRVLFLIFIYFFLLSMFFFYCRKTERLCQADRQRSTSSTTIYCLTLDTTSSFKESRMMLSLIHIWRCRRSYACRSRWSPYH